ncbi:hypothetical protein ACH50O_15070 [Methylomonas sp. 2BW1-5-20]|uniref:hypothetical protein n=1 Tax=Methylomonas sp. 2BW1-5-20 TaxID=3376686 RepID=UPI00404CB90F
MKSPVNLVSSILGALAAIPARLLGFFSGPSIESYLNCQFKYFLLEYYRSIERTNEPIREYIKNIISEKSECAEWSDICALRVAIIDHQELHELTIEEKHLKHRFKTIADDDQIQAYEDFTKATQDDQDSLGHLRAQAIYLAHRLYWTYSLATKGHQIRSCVSIMVSLLFIALLVFMFSYSHVYSAPEKSDLLASVACFGAFGAYVSFHRRMSKLKIQNETYLSFLQLRSSYFDGISALFSGALFSVFVMVLWESNALSRVLGVVFNPELINLIVPQNTPYERGCPTSLQGLFICMSINGSIDFAKLLVMSFLAGFAEKLIPDAIDGLVEKARPKQ